MNTYSPSALSGSVVVPSDRSIYAGQVGRLQANDVAGYRLRWGLMTGAIDPRWQFADCDGSIETQGPAGSLAQSVASTSESGINGPDSQVRFAKAADPDNAAKFCFVMRREQGDESTLKRTELSFSPTFTPVPLGAVCWIGFAFRIPAAWKAASAGDETMVFQVHETTDAGDDTQPAPIGMLVKGQGMLAWVRSNPNATTLAASTTYAEVWSESSYPSDAWQFFVVKLRSGWNASHGHRLEMWRRVGQTTVKIIDHGGPNSYNNAIRDYVKSGLYYYDDEWSGGLTERQMHHKGIYQWLDMPGMRETDILDFLATI